MSDFFRSVRDMFPSEVQMREVQEAETRVHLRECEAPAEDEKYEFVSYDGVIFVEIMCWCGRGMRYEET